MRVQHEMVVIACQMQPNHAVLRPELRHFFVERAMNGQTTPQTCVKMPARTLHYLPRPVEFSRC